MGIDTLTCWVPGSAGGGRQIGGSENGTDQLRIVSSRRTGFAGRWRSAEWLFSHPKVLFWFLSRASYDYAGQQEFMDDVLARALGTSVAPANDHEWDAALSAFAALEGLSGRWTHDLHSLPARGDERLLTPCGMTHYCWPE